MQDRVRAWRAKTVWTQERVDLRSAARRTTYPRQYSPLRWARIAVLYYPVGRGRAVAAGAAGSDEATGPLLVLPDLLVDLAAEINGDF